MRAPRRCQRSTAWHLGGAIADAAPEATAFYHREKPYMINFEASWDDPEETEASVMWARKGIAAVRDTGVASGAYDNFPGVGEDLVRLLYGENYDRLVELKRRYDPENLFRLDQNIDPETTDAE